MGKQDSNRPRRPVAGPDPDSPNAWLRLEDEELLYHIEALPADHGEDQALLEIVRSDRHFFIRQEAAKRIRDPERLKQHASDRHIGQILARVMRRAEDVEYLRRLVKESRHLEVRKAAEAQLRLMERSRSNT